MEDTKSELPPESLLSVPPSAEAEPILFELQNEPVLGVAIKREWKLWPLIMKKVGKLLDDSLERSKFTTEISQKIRLAILTELFFGKSVSVDFPQNANPETIRKILLEVIKDLDPRLIAHVKAIPPPLPARASQTSMHAIRPSQSSLPAIQVPALVPPADDEVE